ncbi:NfeD family protein [Nocardioides sp. YIM 152588]|uniref:NfeD family protein n=1 Tax=Nocardioides sp. YIM 152588 TaxID=3158259 RepID=UPI0032E382A5
MDWWGENLWAAWLGSAGLLFIAEMFSLDLFLAMLAVGALAGMGTSFLTDSFALQAVVASLVSIAMLAVVRPSLAKRLHGGPEIALGNDRLVGLPAVVTESITALHPGRVRLDGEIWTASADAPLEVGEHVEVVKIQGATAHVRARSLPNAHDEKEIP